MESGPPVCSGSSLALRGWGMGELHWHYEHTLPKRQLGAMLLSIPFCPGFAWLRTGMEGDEGSEEEEEAGVCFVWQ